MYTLRDSVFNPSEYKFYQLLKERFESAGYHVFPKMRIVDFIDPHKDFTRLHKTWAKHVDFLICDAHFKPFAAVELNGKSHLDPAREASDEFKKELFEEVGLRFFVVSSGTDFENDIEKLSTALLL